MLIPGGSESLVYTTISGGVGMLVPFTSREVSDFFCFEKFVLNDLLLSICVMKLMA